MNEAAGPPSNGLGYLAAELNLIDVYSLCIVSDDSYRDNEGENLWRFTYDRPVQPTRPWQCPAEDAIEIPATSLKKFNGIPLVLRYRSYRRVCTVLLLFLFFFRSSRWTFKLMIMIFWFISAFTTLVWIRENIARPSIDFHSERRPMQ